MSSKPKSILKNSVGKTAETPKPSFNYQNLKKSKSRSKSVKKRGDSPVTYSDPRQQIYEAKFERFLANK